MIIRQDKSYETNSMFPNVDWYDEGNFIIDETTTMGQQIAEIYVRNYPFVDFEHNEEFVTNVTVLDKPERLPEIEGKEIILKQDDEVGYYYEYEDIPLTSEEKRIRQLEIALLELTMVLGGDE